MSWLLTFLAFLPSLGLTIIFSCNHTCEETAKDPHPKLGNYYFCTWWITNASELKVFRLVQWNIKILKILIDLNALTSFFFFLAVNKFSYRFSLSAKWWDEKNRTWSVRFCLSQSGLFLTSLVGQQNLSSSFAICDLVKILNPNTLAGYIYHQQHHYY